MEIPYIETRWNYRGQNMIGELDNIFYLATKSNIAIEHDGGDRLGQADSL